MRNSLTVGVKVQAKKEKRSLPSEVVAQLRAKDGLRRSRKKYSDNAEYASDYLFWGA